MVSNANTLAHGFVLPDDPRVPMTYLDHAGERMFQDETAPCGEDFARPCGIGASNRRGTPASR
jgi:hypothetical protein